MTQKGRTTLKLALISLSILTVYSAPVYHAVSIAQANTASSPGTLPRLSGRPGWNPLWGIGPVIPPPGSLDNVPVSNEDPSSDTDTTGTDTTDTSNTVSGLDTANDDTTYNLDVATPNVSDADSDTTNKDGANSNTPN